MSGEWQAMSNEERLRLRKDDPPVSEHENEEPGTGETAVEERTVSGPSRRSSMMESSNRMKRQSFASMSAASNAAATDNEDAEEDFTDAKTSVDGQRLSVYKDAKETAPRPSRDIPTTAEEDQDGTLSDSESRGTQAKGKAKADEDNDSSDASSEDEQ
jgi:hypothetical protein